MDVNHVYAGVLVTGESIVRVEGYVDREACDYALASVGEFVADGVTSIILDCSGVRNLPQAWFDDQIRDLYLEHVDHHGPLSPHSRVAQIRSDLAR